MDEIVCLKLLKTRKGRNKNNAYTILPNECNDIIALLYIKNDISNEEKSFKLCYNLLNNYSSDFCLNNSTTTCFWVYCDKDIFTKGKRAKRQIPVLISQQNDRLNFYNFAHIKRTSVRLDNREIMYSKKERNRSRRIIKICIIQDNSITFDIYKNTRECINEKNTLYNHYITFEKLFHFAISINKNLSILESLSEKFVKIILKNESSFFIILNDIVCIKFSAIGLSLHVKKILALQNILMNVDNYIYFKKCICRNGFLFLLTLTPQQFLLIFNGETPYLAININKHVLTFFNDFEVSHDSSSVLLMDVHNQMWFLDLKMYCDSILEEGKDVNFLRKRTKIKNVKMYSLYCKEEPLTCHEIYEGKKDLKKCWEEEHNYKWFPKNDIKCIFECYFPDHFELIQKRIYLYKNFRKDNDYSISIKNYQYLEYSKYIQIIREIKNVILGKQNLYQSTNRFEVSNEKGKNYRQNYDMFYFYIKNEVASCYLNTSRNHNNFDCIYNEHGAHGIDNIPLQFRRGEINEENPQTTGVLRKTIDFCMEKKYAIMQNEDIYKSVTSGKRLQWRSGNDWGNAMWRGSRHFIGEGSLWGNFCGRDFFFNNENATKKEERWRVMVPIDTDNSHFVQKEKGVKLEESINSLNVILPKYMQHIHMYRQYVDVKKLLIIRGFQNWCKKDYSIVEKEKIKRNKNFLYNRKLENIKISTCKDYFFIQLFFPNEDKRKNKNYVIVLRKKKKVKFLCILKNFTYFYVKNETYAILHFDNTLCKVIFKNHINTLISIGVFNVRNKAEEILKLNHFKRHYYYIIMIYNGFLNKDIILVKKSLNILSFKETLLLCRILFHYIWNNFNMEIIYFYFVDYFSFINHIWKKKYKWKIRQFAREINIKKEFIKIYFSLVVKNVSDVVDNIGKKLLCFHDTIDFKNSITNNIFDVTQKGGMNNYSLTFCNTREEKSFKIYKKVVYNGEENNPNLKKISNSLHTKREEIDTHERYAMKEEEIYNDKFVCTLGQRKPQMSRGKCDNVNKNHRKNSTLVLKPDCDMNNAIDGSFQMGNSFSSNGKRQSGVFLHDVMTITCAEKDTQMFSNYNLKRCGESNHNVIYHSIKNDDSHSIPPRSNLPHSDLPRRNIPHSNPSRSNIPHDNTSHSDKMKMFEVIHFEKACLLERHNLFLNRKYSMEICSTTLQFIILFMEKFRKRNLRRGSCNNRGENKIFLEMNKYVYFIKILMNILLENNTTDINEKKIKKRSVSRTNVWEDQKMFYHSNGKHCEFDFFNSTYMNVYNVYDVMSKILYVKKSPTDKLNRLLFRQDKEERSANSGREKHSGISRTYGENAKSYLKEEGYDIKKNRFSEEGRSLYIGSPLTAYAHSNTCSQMNVKSKMAELYQKNTMELKGVLCREIIHSEGKNEIMGIRNVDSDSKGCNRAETWEDLLFYLSYCFMVCTKTKKKLPYFNMKDVYYGDVMKSNVLISDNSTFNYIVYDILSNNNLSMIIYYIYSKKIEFFFNFTLLYFNYNILHNFLAKYRNKFIKNFHYCITRKSDLRKDSQKEDDTFKMGESHQVSNKAEEERKQNNAEYDLFFNKLMNAVINNSGIMINKEQMYNYHTIVNYFFGGNSNGDTLLKREKIHIAANNDNVGAEIRANRAHIAGREKNGIRESDNHDEQDNLGCVCGKLCNGSGKNIRETILRTYGMYDTLRDSFTKLENEVDVRKMHTIFNFQCSMKSILKTNLVNIVLAIYKLIIRDRRKMQCSNYFRKQIMHHLIKNVKIPFSYIHFNPHKILTNYYGSIIYRLLCSNIDTYLNVCIYILKVLCVDVLHFLKIIAFNTLKKYIRNKLLLFLRKNSCSFNKKEERNISFISFLEIFYRNSSYITEHNIAYTNYIFNRNAFKLYKDTNFLKRFKRKLHHNAYNYLHDVVYKEKDIFHILNHLNMYNESSNSSLQFANYFNHSSFFFAPFLMQNFFRIYTVHKEHTKKKEKKQFHFITHFGKVFLGKKMNHRWRRTRGKIGNIGNIWCFKMVKKWIIKCAFIVRKRKLVYQVDSVGYSPLVGGTRLRYNVGAPIKILTAKITDFYDQKGKRKDYSEKCGEINKGSNNKGDSSLKEYLTTQKGKYRISVSKKDLVQNSPNRGSNIEKVRKLMKTPQVHCISLNNEIKCMNKLYYCYVRNRKGNENVVTFHMAKNWMKLKGEEVDDLMFISYQKVNTNVIKEKLKIRMNSYLNYVKEKKEKGYYDFANYDNECYCYTCYEGGKKHQGRVKHKKGKTKIQVDYNYSNVDTLDEFVLHNNHIIENISDLVYKDKVIPNDKYVQCSYVNSTFLLERKGFKENKGEKYFIQKGNTLIKDPAEQRDNCTTAFKRGGKKIHYVPPSLNRGTAVRDKTNYNYRLTPCEIPSSGSYLCCSLVMLKTVNKCIMVRIVLENRGLNFLFFLMKYFFGKAYGKSSVSNACVASNASEVCARGDGRGRVKGESDSRTEGANYVKFKKAGEIPLNPVFDLRKHQILHCKEEPLDGSEKRRMKNSIRCEDVEKKRIYKRILLKNCNGRKTKIEVKNLFYELVKVIDIKSYNSSIFLHILEYYSDNNNMSAVFVLLLTLKCFSANFFKTMHKSANFNFYEMVKIVRKNGGKKRDYEKRSSQSDEKKNRKTSSYHKSNVTRGSNIYSSLRVGEKNFLKIINYIQNDLRDKSTCYMYDHIESSLESLGIFLHKFDFLYKIKIFLICPCAGRSISRGHSKRCHIADIVRTRLVASREKKYSAKSEKTLHVFTSNDLRKEKKGIHVYYNIMVKLSRNFLCFNYLSYQDICNKFNVHVYFGNTESLLQYRKKYISYNRINYLHMYILIYFITNQSLTSMYFFILKNGTIFQTFKNCNYLMKKIYKGEKNIPIFEHRSDLCLSYIPCYVYSQLPKSLLALSLYNSAILFQQEVQIYLRREAQKGEEDSCKKNSEVKVEHVPGEEIQMCKKEYLYTHTILHMKRENTYKGEIEEGYDVVSKKRDIYELFLRRDEDNISYMPLQLLSLLNVKLFFCIFAFSNVDIFDFKKNKQSNPLYINIYYFKKLAKCFMPSVYEAYFTCKTRLKRGIKRKLEKEKGRKKNTFKLAIQNLKKYKENYLKVQREENPCNDSKLNKSVSRDRCRNEGNIGGITDKYRTNFCFENLLLIKEINGSENYGRKDNFKLVTKICKMMEPKGCNSGKKHIYNDTAQFDQCYDFFTYNKDMSLKIILEKTVDEKFFKTYFLPFSIFENLFKRVSQNISCSNLLFYKSDKDVNQNCGKNYAKRKGAMPNSLHLFCNNILKENKMIEREYSHRKFLSYFRKRLKMEDYNRSMKKSEDAKVMRNTTKEEMEKGNVTQSNKHITYENDTHTDNTFGGKNKINHLKKNRFYFLKHFDVKYFLISCQPLIAYHILILNTIFYRYEKPMNLQSYLRINEYNVTQLNDYVLNNVVNFPLNLDEELKNIINCICLELSIFYFRNNDILCSILCFLDLCNVNIEKLKMYILCMKSIYYYFKKNSKKKIFYDKWVRKCIDFLHMEKFSEIDFYNRKKTVFYKIFPITEVNFYDLFKKSFNELIVIKLFLELSKEGERGSNRPGAGTKIVMKFGSYCADGRGISAGILTKEDLSVVRGKCAHIQYGDGVDCDDYDGSTLYQDETRKLNFVKGDTFVEEAGEKHKETTLPGGETFFGEANTSTKPLEENQTNKPAVGEDYYVCNEKTGKFFILILLEKSIQYRIREKKKKKKKKYFNDLLNIISLYCKVNNVHQPLTLLHILSRKNDIFIFFYECIDKIIDIKTCQDIINLYTKNKYTKRHIITFLSHVRRNVHMIMKFQEGVKNVHSAGSLESDPRSDHRKGNRTGDEYTLKLLEGIRSIFIGNKHIYDAEGIIKNSNKTVLELLYTIIYNNFDYRRVRAVIEQVLMTNRYYTKFYLYLTAYVQFTFRKDYSFSFEKGIKKILGKKYMEVCSPIVNFKKYENMYGKKFDSYCDFKNFLIFIKKKREEYTNLIIMLKNVWFFLQISGYLLFLKNMELVDVNTLTFFTFIQKLREYKINRLDLFFNLIKKEETTYIFIFFLLSNGIFNLLGRFLYLFHFNEPIVCLCNFVKCIYGYRFSKAEYHLKKHYNKYISNRTTAEESLYYIFFTHVINYVLMNYPNVRYIVLKMLLKTKQDCKYVFDFYTYKTFYALNLRKGMYPDIFQTCEELIRKKKFRYIKGMLSKIYALVDDSSLYSFRYNEGYIKLSRIVLLHYTCFKNFLHIIKEKKYVDNYVFLLYKVSQSFFYSNVIFLLFLLNYSYTCQSKLGIYEQAAILLLCIFIINTLKGESKEKSGKQRKGICMLDYVKEKIVSVKRLFCRNCRVEETTAWKDTVEKSTGDNTTVGKTTARRGRSSKLCILSFLPLSKEECEEIFLFKEYNENRKKHMKQYKGQFPNFEICHEYENLNKQFYNYSENYLNSFNKNINVIRCLCICKNTLNILKWKVIYLLSISTKNKIRIPFDELNISHIESILKIINKSKNENVIVHVHSIKGKKQTISDTKARKKLRVIYALCENVDEDCNIDKKNCSHLLTKQRGSIAPFCENINESRRLDSNCYTNDRNNYTSVGNTYKEKNRGIPNMETYNQRMILKENEKEGGNKNGGSSSIHYDFIFSVKKHTKMVQLRDNINIFISIFMCINNLINNFEIVKAQRVIDMIDIQSVYRKIKVGEKKALMEKKKKSYKTAQSYSSKGCNKSSSAKKDKKVKNATTYATKIANSYSVFSECLNSEENPEDQRLQEKETYKSCIPLSKIRNCYLNRKKEIDIRKNLEVKLNCKYDKSFLQIDEIYKYIYYNSICALLIFYYLCIDKESGLQLINSFPSQMLKKKSAFTSFEHFIEISKSECSCDIYKFIVVSQLLFTIKKKTFLIVRPIFSSSNDERSLLMMLSCVLKNFMNINGKCFDVSLCTKFVYLFGSRMNIVATNLLIYHSFVSLLMANFHRCKSGRSSIRGGVGIDNIAPTHLPVQRKGVTKKGSRRNLTKSKMERENAKDAILIYYECSQEFLSKYTNLVITNECNLTHENFYFSSILDAYFYLFKMLRRGSYCKRGRGKRQGKRETWGEVETREQGKQVIQVERGTCDMYARRGSRRKTRRYHCFSGYFHKLLFNVDRGDPLFTSSIFSNMVCMYRSDGVVLPLEVEVEILLFLYKIACKFTSEAHIMKVKNIIRKRVSTYVRRRKLYLVFRLLVGINEYDKLDFLFKLLFESNSIFDFLKYSKNIFLSVNAYNFNCDLSVSLNSDCLVHNERVCRYKSTFNTIYQHDHGKKNVCLKTTNSVNGNLCNGSTPGAEGAYAIGRRAKIEFVEESSTHSSNGTNYHIQNGKDERADNVCNLLNILQRVYIVEKKQRESRQNSQMNISHNFNGMHFSDLITLYESNYVRTFLQNASASAFFSPSYLFYDDGVFAYILSTYITSYCKEFGKGDVEILTQIYRKIGLKHELYELLKRETESCLKIVSGDKDVFDDINKLNTIILCLNVLHHCSVLLLEVQNLQEYNYNLNVIYLLILQLKYIYLYKKQNLQISKNSNFSSYINNYIELNSLKNSIICEENIHKVFENILQDSIPNCDYKINFLDLSLENFITLIEKHPTFYETLILLKAYENNYDDLVYSFIPKILFIQVVIYDNRKYLLDYCSYSCIDKNMLKYIVKLFKVNSLHLKVHKNFPTKKYKYITIKKNMFTFNFSSYILSAININYATEDEKRKIWNYERHVLSLKYILSQITNVYYRMQVCKKLGADFNDVHYECKNILNLTMN
ncbi:conserved Plasmodium protein, unknown function [Plasmodium ovale]|uniref:Spatacsin C-terminal domain-containing protein n=1 Tax=Plasmodium ovale TaxID=36330 RepID=A0A1D3TL13_PLAOA|nr:conserved Plasmodium protein, unknown function [Plasmodium ovale]